MTACRNFIAKAAAWMAIVFGSIAMTACGRSATVDAGTPITAPSSPREALGPLRVSAANPRYFVDGTGREVLLVGSHTWGTLNDLGFSSPPPAFDFEAYLDFLERNGHNFARLWAAEQARWALAHDNDDFRVRPLPYLRSGPGNALDGLPRFDLTRFDPEYFERLRARVQAAARRGIYVSVMLFEGFSVVKAKGDSNRRNPWLGHPFHRANNVNGIDGDPNADDSGEETHTLALPAVTALQDAYVRNVVDAVNEFDNVLYEVSNESEQSSVAWQAHVIELIRDHQSRKPKQHPIGMTSIWPNGQNDDLYRSPADWISPNGDVATRTPSDGRKVVLVDTDHLCGICGDPAWVWKAVTSGENPIFMDPYGREPPPGMSVPWRMDDPLLVSVRANLGYARALSTRLDLAAMRPRPELASSRYCLATVSPDRAQLLVYLAGASSLELDLRDSAGSHQVTWLDLRNGYLMTGQAVLGGARVRLTSPISGDSVLYLHRGS